MFQRNRPKAPRSAWWLVPIGLVIAVGGILWGMAAGGDVPGRVELLPVIGVGTVILGVILGIRGKRLR